VPSKNYVYTEEDNVHGTAKNLADLNGEAPGNVGDPAKGTPLSPLVYQTGGVSSTPGAQTKIPAYAANTTILEQPVDFSTLAPKCGARFFVAERVVARGVEFGFMMLLGLKHSLHVT
jgi:hypothetical protein